MSITRHYCTSCKENVVSHAKSPSHVLHFFLTLFMCGLWLPVWILATLNPGYNCSQCGGATYGGVGMLWVNRIVGATVVFCLLVVLLIIVMGRP